MSQESMAESTGSHPRRVQIFAPIDIEGGSWSEAAAESLAAHIREVAALMERAEQVDDPGGATT